jgi:hypothetical protein
MLPRLALTFALAAFVCPAVSFAQSPQSQPESEDVAPAHVAHVDGAASLEREGRAENAPLNMPLLSGDRLRTAEGRVEVLFADGSTLHLDMRTTIDVQSDDLVRLIDGRLRLNIVGPARTVAYRVDSPAGSVRITQPGEYRIALLHGENETQVELAVLRGGGEVFTDQGSTPVRAGERAYASAGLAPSYPYSYNSATWDAFDRWSENRRDVRLGVSAQYLPSDMRTYAPLLDESGDWRYNQSYGYVWYPRVVADWRPYYYGRWISYPRYGWTWIGADRFAWPTHHFGRWGFSAGVWFWIPGSRWSPAYVSWGYAPGYVSWCPLGFDNRPVIGVNIFSVGPGFYSSSRAWTSIAFSHFGRDFVHHRAVNWDRFDRGRRPTFEERRTPPGFSRDVAVARNSTPIRWAGSNAGARGVSPAPGGFASRDNRAIPRETVTPPRDGSRLPAARSTETPRYVNRGDAIIRSQTERPTPPRQDPVRQVAPQTGLPARDGYYATPRRTAPEGPARAADPRMDSAPDPRIAQPRTFEPRPGMQSPAGRIDGRAPGRVDGSAPGLVGGRSADSPVYQPRYEARPRGYEPPQRQAESSPRQAPPQPPAQMSPGRAEGRQPPPQRAAPSERAAPRETAVPRNGGPAQSGGQPGRRGGGGRGGH